VKDDNKLETAKKRFKLARDAESKQRDREKDDLKFQIPEEQWEESARRQRLGSSVDGVPTPARPVLSISKIDQPIQLVLNQERSSKLAVTIQPLSPDAGQEVAIILEGIYRRIERDSQAAEARSWAFDRAVKCGRGAYRVNTVYDEDAFDVNDPTTVLDQEIVIERILHQNAVYFDPSARKADFSDGEYAFMVSWVPFETFRRDYPKARTEGDGALTWSDMTQEEPDWVRGAEDDNPAVMVAEYWYKEHDIKDVGPVGQERKKDFVSVKWCKLSGFEILEEEDWNGKFIPLIPVIGRELQPYDEERRWTGVIANAKDAQRMYNYAASQAVELAALEPKAPFIGVEGQFAGHEEEWGQANIRNFPYLEYVPVSLGGQPAPPPQRVQVDVGRLGPSMQLLQQADNFMQVTTATFDPGLGRESARDKSGKAIMALQQQGDASNSHYLANLAQISMMYEARVVLDLIPSIYDRPGRIAQVLDEEGETKTVMLNQPFYTEPETERPVPMMPGMQPPMMPPQQGGQPPQQGMQGPPQQGPPGMGGPQMQGPPMPPQPAKVKHFDLRKGIYTVAVSIGKQRQTALQEGAEEIGRLLESRPEMMPILGPLYFQYREFPGAKQLAELLKKMRDQQFPFLAEDGEEGQPSPEQMQSQLQQMQQQMQQMQQQLQAAAQQIETDQAKQQATLQKAEMDNQTKLQIAKMEQETKLTLEGVKAQMAQSMEEIKAQIALLGKGADQEHVSQEKELDRDHDVEMEATKALLAPYDGPAEESLEAEE